MIKTTYTCDKCKQDISEVPRGNPLWGISIKYSANGNENYNWTHKTIEVCRPCLESLGMAVKQDTKPAPPPPPDVIDLIRQIADIAGIGDQE